MGEEVDDPNNVCRADFSDPSLAQFGFLYNLEPSALTPTT